MSSDFTTIKISLVNRDALNALKKIPREPINEVIGRLLHGTEIEPEIATPPAPSPDLKVSE